MTGMGGAGMNPGMGMGQFGTNMPGFGAMGMNPMGGMGMGAQNQPSFNSVFGTNAVTPQVN